MLSVALVVSCHEPLTHRGMLYVFVLMIYVVVSSKYAKFVITVQAHQELISLPALSHFRKIFMIGKLSFTGP